MIYNKSLTAINCVLALLLVATSHQIAADSVSKFNGLKPYQLETNYINFIEVFGRQVPLPGGTWILAGVGIDPASKKDKRPYGVLATFVLFNLEGKNVTAFTLIHVNAIATDGGWGISKDCQRNNYPFAKIYENGEQHAFCAFIHTLTTSVIPNDDALPAWKNAVQLAMQKGWYLPVRWREVGFRISNWHDVLDVRYAFKGQDLISKQQPTLESTPEATLIHWVEGMLPGIYLGFKRSLTHQSSFNMPYDYNPSHTKRSFITDSRQNTLSNSSYSLLKIVVSFKLIWF
ncbi:hypothetical protein TI04_12500 [Achromatium sp. WMS2]|nr:hypothetical protein TI04_12500 [Achromatium sp. WMS2]